jgi:predicted ABC-type ATPase
MPDVFMIGGANGSGKTTAAMSLLPGYLDVFEFVNADEIARGLNPLKPETADMTAGKAMIQRIHDLTAAGKTSPLKPHARARIMYEPCRIAAKPDTG